MSYGIRSQDSGYPRVAVTGRECKGFGVLVMFCFLIWVLVIRCAYIRYAYTVKSHRLVSTLMICVFLFYFNNNQ